MAAGAQNLFGVQKPNVGGLGVGVRPTPEMAGMAKAGTARSGVQGASGAMSGLQNQPFFSGSGLHPGIETGYGLTSGYVDDEYGPIFRFAPSENASKYKPAETFTTDELEKLQVEYDRQEGIRQKKLEKLAELRGIEDLNAGVRAPASQRVGSGAGKIVPIASGPLKRPDDILNTPFLQGLY